MPATLLVQSAPDRRPSFLDRCLASAEAWAAGSGFDYRFLRDAAFFAPVSPAQRAKLGERRVMESDLARLHALRRALDDGYDRVIWLDADVLIFAPADLDLPEAGHALGREVWVQKDAQGRLEARQHVHNAAMVFRADDPVLPFYLHACERIVERLEPGASVPPQLLGPKLVSALHSLVGFPLLAAVGMASPLVLHELAEGHEDGPALSLMTSQSGPGLAGLNLCSSLLGRRVDGVEVTEALIEAAVGRLMARGGRALS